MNLGQAREQIVTMLDDPDGQRWSFPTGAFDPSNEVDLALQSAAVECVSLYAHSGGDFFDVVQEVQTTNGTFSFTAELRLRMYRYSSKPCPLKMEETTTVFMRPVNKI